MKRLFLVCSLAAALMGIAAPGFAQTIGSTGVPATPVTIQTQYPLVPISATSAVNVQTTLTIPAPPQGWYNYICTLHFNASQNATATVQTNAVTTSTNFGGYAIKYSLAATANINYDWLENWIVPTVGCAKSTAPGTATTFVSPAAAAQLAFTWTGTYYQAP